MGSGDFGGSGPLKTITKHRLLQL